MSNPVLAIACNSFVYATKINYCINPAKIITLPHTKSTSTCLRINKRIICAEVSLEKLLDGRLGAEKMLCALLKYFIWLYFQGESLHAKTFDLNLLGEGLVTN